jgi:acetoacetyl-CoA synthetase
VRIILFVVLKDGLILDKQLKLSICNVIRKNTTPRHVPEKIIQIKEIPRTRSGKLVELSVRSVIHGEEVKNKEALANPESLENFRDLLELQS